MTRQDPTLSAKNVSTFPWCVSAWRISWRRRSIWAIAAIALYLSIVAILTIFQRRLIYRAGGTIASPAQSGLPNARADRLRTADGEVLPVWTSPAKPGRVTFLYFHGYSRSIADRAGLFARMTARGDGLVAVEYRGWPGATGTPTEAGLLLDAQAAWRHALAQGVAPRSIIVVGESLGGGPAIAVAAANAPLGLILDSTFAQIGDPIGHLLPFLPVSLMLRDTWRSDERIGKVRAPILQIHGAKDRRVPLWSAQSLHARATASKALRVVEDGAHVLLGRTLDEALDWSERLSAPRDHEAPPALPGE